MSALRLPALPAVGHGELGHSVCETPTPSNVMYARCSLLKEVCTD